MTKQLALQNVLKDPMDREAWRVLGEIMDWGSIGHCPLCGTNDLLECGDNFGYIYYGEIFMYRNLTQGRPAAELYLINLVGKE